MKTCGYWYKRGDDWHFVTKEVHSEFDYEHDEWIPADGNVSFAFGCGVVLPDKAIRKLYKKTRKFFVVPWYKKLRLYALKKARAFLSDFWFRWILAGGW